MRRSHSRILCLIFFLLCTACSAAEKNDMAELSFEGMKMDEESVFEVNGTYEGNVYTAGRRYTEEDIKNMEEKLKEIETVSISNAYFSSLEFMSGFDKLKDVSFYACTFSDGVSLPVMECLERVTIHDCQLKDLEVIRNNTNIFYLQLGYNQITDIDGLKEFENLQYINLIGNDISSVDALEGLQSLECIELLDGNWNLRSLQPLFHLDRLNRISMNQRTFENIPEEETAFFGVLPDGIIEID